MILWLASYPRSGNTFFRAVLKHIYDIPSETIYEFNQTEMATWRKIKKVVDFQPEQATSLAELIASEQVHIVKTHDLPQEDFPAVYIVRDGRDALVSHAHYVLQYDWKLPLEERESRFYEALRMLVETDVSFGGWSSNVLAWLARTTPTAVLKFEDLILSPLEAVHNALIKVDYHPPQRLADQVPTFEELRNAEPQFFRKGRVGAWREEMPDDLHDLFWQRHAEAMNRIGYSRE